MEKRKGDSACWGYRLPSRSVYLSPLVLQGAWGSHSYVGWIPQIWSLGPCSRAVERAMGEQLDGKSCSCNGKGASAHSAGLPKAFWHMKGQGLTDHNLYHHEIPPLLLRSHLAPEALFLSLCLVSSTGRIIIAIGNSLFPWSSPCWCLISCSYMAPLMPCFQHMNAGILWISFTPGTRITPYSGWKST